MVVVTAAHPDLHLVSVGLAETPEDLSSFLAPYGITWPAVPDRDGSISERWQVDLLPVTVLVDPDGNVRHRWTGVVDPAQFSDAMTRCPARAAVVGLGFLA